MKGKHNNFNTIKDFSKTSPLECSAGPMTFIPLSNKTETTSKNIRDYLNEIYNNVRIREIYDSLRFKLIKIIDYIPKII